VRFHIVAHAPADRRVDSSLATSTKATAALRPSARDSRGRNREGHEVLPGRAELAANQCETYELGWCKPPHCAIAPQEQLGSPVVASERSTALHRSASGSSQMDSPAGAMAVGLIVLLACPASCGESLCNPRLEYDQPPAPFTRTAPQAVEEALHILPFSQSTIEPRVATGRSPRLAGSRGPVLGRIRA